MVVHGKDSSFQAVVVHGRPMRGTKHPFIEGNSAKSPEEAMRVLLVATMSLLDYFSELFIMLDEDDEDECKTTEGGQWYGPEEA